jgi:hypothetical protein
MYGAHCKHRLCIQAPCQLHKGTSCPSSQTRFLHLLVCCHTCQTHKWGPGVASQDNKQQYGTTEQCIKQNTCAIVYMVLLLTPAGDIPAAYMPWVLRIAAACSHTSGGDSQAAMADISRGISTWRASLNRGLLPDDEAIQQLLRNGEPFTRGASLTCRQWCCS